MSRPTVDAPVHFLMDNGILFEINRQVLHPLGLEMHLEAGEEGEACRIVLEDNRSVPQPIYFTSDEFEKGRSRYEAYMDAHGAGGTFRSAARSGW